MLSCKKMHFSQCVSIIFCLTVCQSHFKFLNFNISGQSFGKSFKNISADPRRLKMHSKVTYTLIQYSVCYKQSFRNKKKKLPFTCLLLKIDDHYSISHSTSLYYYLLLPPTFFTHFLDMKIQCNTTYSTKSIVNYASVLPFYCHHLSFNCSQY